MGDLLMLRRSPLATMVSFIGVKFKNTNIIDKIQIQKLS